MQYEKTPLGKSLCICPLSPTNVKNLNARESDGIPLRAGGSLRGRGYLKTYLEKICMPLPDL